MVGNLTISPLRQAPCDNRSRASQDVNPSAWIEGVLPLNWRMYSFHFFVDWGKSPPVLSSTLIMTRLIESSPGVDFSVLNDEEILLEFCSSSFSACYGNFKSVAQRYGKILTGLLLPELDVGSISDRTPVWIVNSSLESFPEIKRSNIMNLKRAIQKHSGGPVHVGAKGLIHGTSSVECYLSNTDSAFPGDADAVIVDADGSIRFILEFKKHTLSDDLGNHLMQKYFPRPDGRKYLRLNALASDIGNSSNSRIPLIVLYYSTRKPLIRLQEIGRMDTMTVEIAKDSGDLETLGLSEDQVGRKILNWLGIEK